jgi:hypothetical protein
MQWFPLAFCMIVFRHTVGLLWTSDQPVSETSTCTGQHNRQASMPSAGFEPATPATKRPQTYALDLILSQSNSLHTDNLFVQNPFQTFGVFWDVAPCSHVKVDRRFRDAYSIHQQGSTYQKTLNFILKSHINFRCYLPHVILQPRIDVIALEKVYLLTFCMHFFVIQSSCVSSPRQDLTVSSGD